MYCKELGVKMVPSVIDKKWKELVLGQKSYQFNLLSIKIMMSRILIKIKKDASPANIDSCIKEIHEFFMKNEKICQRDLNQIFGEK
jgi:hypothetical protein